MKLRPSLPHTFLAGLLMLAAIGASAAELTARAVGLADGDTNTVLDAQHVQHKIRLAGIDAPEKAQPFGNVSRQHLASLVFGREVVVDAEKLDRYGRTVGRA